MTATATTTTRTFPVRLRQSLAGVRFSAEKGDVYEAATAVEAHRLVRRGIAEPIGELPKLTPEEEKIAGMLHVSTVKAKGNRARVEPLEDRQARDAAEARRKREQRGREVEEEAL